MMAPTWKKTVNGYWGKGFPIVGNVWLVAGVLTVNNVRYQMPLKATLEDAEAKVAHIERLMSAKSESSDSSEQTQRDVTELIACGRIQDAIDRVAAYLATSTHRAHTLNQIKKLARLGIVAGAKFIDHEGTRYHPITSEGL